ncbi:hypothetical protein NIES4072_29880 [Nostoc commune NIES-4072]|uniref:Uncharacterized protein n=1 Tax=Nostoc commune NIES-4072 TaxID=2005467 RepID=A0A2R5FU19_NOSCO|nr:hypothetical protein [Nostoc commune]BBD69677.1 hypothetical protein NIES4070_60870 [Nostoc commune HK-02]GBG19321.1 hypothetical protein NIES4072_29880 [Nostoc commune NIES-4072]
MTKHDTWVKLKPGNPYEPILDLFPDGMIPMRDPFALERVNTSEGFIALWIIDMERLSSFQAQALAQIIAIHHNTDPLEVAQEATAKGGFAMNAKWVESMKCWAEGFARTKELNDFLETVPDPETPAGAQAFTEFCNSQHERWIEGDEVPPPINSIEDIDPRLRTPELEQAFKMVKIERVIATGNYSVMDVLTGRAMVDVLNQTDPENTYSLVGYDDEFDEDEIYE